MQGRFAGRRVPRWSARLRTQASSEEDAVDAPAHIRGVTGNRGTVPQQHTVPATVADSSGC